MKGREGMECLELLGTYNSVSLARFPNSEGRAPSKLFELKPLKA
jgi:hypothetical protein